MTSNSPLSTINDLFLRIAASTNPHAILWQDEFGHWQPLSSDKLYHRTRALAATSFTRALPSSRQLLTRNQSMAFLPPSTSRRAG